MNERRRAVITAASMMLLALPSLAHAQDDIVTDRPTAAASSLTVGKDILQIELGTAGALTRGEDQLRSLRVPLKLRFGLSKRIEAHFESDTFGVDASQGQRRSGLNDIHLGGKAHLLEGGGALPSLGLMLALRLPSDSALSGRRVALIPTLAADWSFTDRLGLGVNLGGTAVINERQLGGDALHFAAAFGFGATDRLGLFLETFGGFGFQGVGPTISADTGATFKVTPSLQLDAYVRAESLNTPDAMSLGGGLGVSLRM